MPGPGHRCTKDDAAAPRARFRCRPKSEMTALPTSSGLFRPPLRDARHRQQCASRYTPVQDCCRSGQVERLPDCRKCRRGAGPPPMRSEVSTCVRLHLCIAQPDITAGSPPRPASKWRNCLCVGQCETRSPKTCVRTRTVNGASASGSAWTASPERGCVAARQPSHTVSRDAHTPAIQAIRRAANAGRCRTAVQECGLSRGTRPPAAAGWRPRARWPVSGR